LSLQRREWLLGGAALLSLSGLGIALVTQHVFGMLPCAWCVFQRLICVVIAVVALLGLAWRTRLGARVSAGLTLLAGLCGVAAALWHLLVASSSTSCNLSLAEKIVSGLTLDETLPAVFMPMASCADATATLLGLPYPLWSLSLFVMATLAALLSLRGR
jgi:disulfide bond formation protein DsbB